MEPSISQPFAYAIQVVHLLLNVRLEQLEGQAGQIDSDGLGEIELQELKDEKKEFHHQLQGVARDLTLTLRELESKTPGGECPKQVEATKQVLGHLQEQIATVCEELLIERPTARQKKAGQQKSRGSSEHASAALTAVSSENEQLQSACQQLQLGANQMLIYLGRTSDLDVNMFRHKKVWEKPFNMEDWNST